MCPTHTNKGGLRYRYCVSQAAPNRVPAAELEALIVAALRNHLTTNGAGRQFPDSDRDLIERLVERVTLAANEIKLRLRCSGRC
jgi:hypothetical protein